MGGSGSLFCSSWAAPPWQHPFEPWRNNQLHPVPNRWAYQRISHPPVISQPTVTRHPFSRHSPRTHPPHRQPRRPPQRLCKQAASLYGNSPIIPSTYRSSPPLNPTASVGDSQSSSKDSFSFTDHTLRSVVPSSLVQSDTSAQDLLEALTENSKPPVKECVPLSENPQTSSKSPYSLAEDVTQSPPLSVEHHMEAPPENPQPLLNDYLTSLEEPQPTLNELSSNEYYPPRQRSSSQHLLDALSNPRKSSKCFQPVLKPQTTEGVKPLSSPISAQKSPEASGDPLEQSKHLIPPPEDPPPSLEDHRPSLKKVLLQSTEETLASALPVLAQDLIDALYKHIKPPEEITPESIEFQSPPKDSPSPTKSSIIKSSTSLEKDTPEEQSNYIQQPSKESTLKEPQLLDARPKSTENVSLDPYNQDQINSFLKNASPVDKSFTYNSLPLNNSVEYDPKDSSQCSTVSLPSASNSAPSLNESPSTSSDSLPPPIGLSPSPNYSSPSSNNVSMLHSNQSSPCSSTLPTLNNLSASRVSPPTLNDNILHLKSSQPTSINRQAVCNDSLHMTNKACNASQPLSYAHPQTPTNENPEEPSRDFPPLSINLDSLSKYPSQLSTNSQSSTKAGKILPNKTKSTSKYNSSRPSKDYQLSFKYTLPVPRKYQLSKHSNLASNDHPPESFVPPQANPLSTEVVMSTSITPMNFEQSSNKQLDSKPIESNPQQPEDLTAPTKDHLPSPYRCSPSQIPLSKNHSEPVANTPAGSQPPPTKPLAHPLNPLSPEFHSQYPHIANNRPTNAQVQYPSNPRSHSVHYQHQNSASSYAPNHVPTHAYYQNRANIPPPYPQTTFYQNPYPKINYPSMPYPYNPYPPVPYYSVISNPINPFYQLMYPTHPLKPGVNLTVVLQYPRRENKKGTQL